MANQNKISAASKAHKPPYLVGGLLDIDQELRSSLAGAISRSCFSREEVADRISQLINRNVTTHMLNSWTATTKAQYRIPADVLLAISVVTEDWSPLAVLAKPIGGLFLSPRERTYIELIRIERARLKIEKRARALKDEMERDA